MCGIFGSYNLCDKNLLLKGLKLLIHRGPDSKGIFLDDSVMLGARRLRITGNDSGNQPVFNEDKSIAAIFNGEIYNHKELRIALENKGHAFCSDSDSEVIVHAYEEFGTSFIDKLDGMFTFAIWDMAKKRLIAARDRFGIKPLYFFRDNEVLLFSSEIKALLQHDGIKKELNKKMLPQYLRFRFISSPDTFMKGICKLEPGSLIYAENGKITIRKYHNIAISKNNHLDKRQLDLLLTSSVEKMKPERMKWGLFFSGGIDSTLLLDNMQKHKKVDTYTIGFEGNAENELNRARIIAEHYGTDHTEITYDKETVFKIIPKIMHYLEEPICDATAIPTFLMSDEASKRNRVVL
ncbi:MAG: asparagine synthase (glutamine-hydrolyzing), partial [Candidatus Woesearchaeota archaeon]|nr:asparagine synthase (glutamine-hydrolyzing) [Candidatus Woesearchaeota archaeon]